MQTEVAFLGNIVGQAGLACDPGVLAWHVPGSVKQVWQFVGFIGYYRRCIHNFAGLSEPMVALTRKGVAFAWTNEQQVALDTLKSCLLQAPILGFPTQEGRFILDTDASLFAVGGVLNQLQDHRVVVIAYATRSLSTTVLHYSTGNVSGGGHVHSFSFVFEGSAVYTVHWSSFA